jgi:hypothetical protein
MEVHPPHGPMHSWRDFWIHLGTITIGLLIAISLEQSVEKIHHIHQRHQLEQDLRAEGVRNIDLVAQNTQVFDSVKAYALTLRQAVDTMRKSGGKVKLPYPIRPKMPTPAAPSDAVWATAKESSLIELLPRERAEIYARLYRQHDLAIKESETLAAARFELSSFEDRFDDAQAKSHPDLTLMTVDDLNEYFILISRFVAASDIYSSRLRSFAVGDRAVLDGATSEDEMRQRMEAARNR